VIPECRVRRMPLARRCQPGRQDRMKISVINLRLAAA
jgi:hypothetical protein